MNPLAALLALLGGRSFGPGDIAPNLTPGAGIPPTFGVGSALPGLSYSPYALPGSPYAGTSGGGQGGTMSDPTGAALTGGTGASGVGTADFLNGALFNSLFPSSPSAAPAGPANPSGGIMPATTGTSPLFNMAGPSSGGVGPAPGGGGGGGNIGVADAGSTGTSLGFQAGLSTPFGTLGGNLGSIQGPSSGVLGQGLTALGLPSWAGTLANLALGIAPFGLGTINSLAGMGLGTANAIGQANDFNQGTISDAANFGMSPTQLFTALGLISPNAGVMGGPAGGFGLTGQEGITSLGLPGQLGVGPTGRGDAPGPGPDAGPTGTPGPDTSGVSGPGPGTPGNPSGEGPSTGGGEGDSGGDD